MRLNYFPHAAQRPFHLGRYRWKYRALLGGTGSGKSLAGAKEALDWAWENVGSVGLVAEPTYRMLKTITVPTLEYILGVRLDISPFFTNFQKTEMRLDAFNGSRIWMVGLDRPEAAEGMNVDWAWLDEARLVPKFKEAWESIQRRLRGSGKSRPVDEKVPAGAVGAWVTTTPNAPGSDLFNFFEHPKKSDPESRVYRMRLDDNPHLDKDYIEAVKRGHSGGLYKRFVEGLFAEVAGGAFDFDYSVHVQGFVMPELRRVAFGVDFGWTAPSAVTAVGFDGDDRAYVLDEIYATRLSEQALIDECLALRERWGDGAFWCDASEPRTIQAMNRQNLDARPNKSKRDEGIREVGGRLKDAGDSRRRLYVSPGCANLIEELQLYDPKRKEHDHAVDALRYAVMGAKAASGEIEVLSGRRKR